MATYFNKANYEWNLVLKNGKSFRIVPGINEHPDLPEGLELKFPKLKVLIPPENSISTVKENLTDDKKIDVPEHFDDDVNYFEKITEKELTTEDVPLKVETKPAKTKKSKKK